MLGFSIEEVPIRWEHRAPSRVRLGRDPLRMLGDLWRIYRDLRGGGDRAPSAPAMSAAAYDVVEPACLEARMAPAEPQPIPH